MNPFIKKIATKEDLPIYSKEVEKLETMLNEYLVADDDILTDASLTLIKSGGKRMRPIVFMFCSGLGPRRKDKEFLRPMAMALEIIHEASLVHDDVVDASLLRHGQPTVKASFGNEISIFTGDYLTGKALELVASYEDKYLNGLFSTVAMEMCRGELMQISSLYGLDDCVVSYLGRVKRKTALLLSAGCEVGAYLSGADPKIVKAMRLYGNAVGMAFQIVDDLLDYSKDQSKNGKAIGGDIRQGLATLPLIFAIQHSVNGDELRHMFKNPGKSEEDIMRIVDIVHQSGAFEYSKKLARDYIEKAVGFLHVVKDSKTKRYLSSVADFVLERSF